MDLKELNQEKIKEIVQVKVEDTMSVITEEWSYMVQQLFKQNAAVAMTAGAGSNETIDVIYDAKHAHITKSELISKIFRCCEFKVEKHQSGSGQYNVSCEIVCNDPKLDMTDPFVEEIIGQTISNTQMQLNYFYH